MSDQETTVNEIDYCIHIAGPFVVMGKHMVQRCAWCGTRLKDVHTDSLGPGIINPYALGFMSSGTVVKLFNDGDMFPLPNDTGFGRDSCLELVDFDL